MTVPTIGELFAGYGGLGMGVQMALGGEVAWVSDLTHHTRKDGTQGRPTGPGLILAHRFPGVPNLGDVTQVDWTQVPRVDILTGGSPCQDISSAGNRLGMTEGTRSNLWLAMLAAIDQLEPALVVWENVGGALNAKATSDMEPCPGCLGTSTGVHMRALGRVLGGLAALGFDAEWVCVRASDTGAPHQRLRVFLVAWPASDPRGLRWLTWRGHGTGTTEGWGTPPDVAGRPRVPLTVLPTPMANEGEKASMGHTTAAGRRATGSQPYLTHVISDLLPTPAVNDMGDNKTVEWWDAWTAEQAAKHGNSNGHGKSLAIEAKRRFLLPTPTTMDGHSSGGGYTRGNVTLTDAAARQGASHVPAWAEYAPAVELWEHLTRPAPSPVEEGRNGRPRLAARFPEWMMGLPEGHVTDVPGLTRTDALKALGNGVVPQQAAYGIETIRRRLLG